ncbi:hypothetical protein MRX96_013356 [Rhipicephalus microplus]
MPIELGMAGRSSNRDVQLGYQWRSGVFQLPNAFMLFAEDERRPTASDNTRGDNRRVNGRPGKRWNSVSAATEEKTCECNVTDAAVDQRQKCADISVAEMCAA